MFLARTMNASKGLTVDVMTHRVLTGVQKSQQTMMGLSIQIREAEVLHVRPNSYMTRPGCKVIGVKPVVLARGELGYWENQIDTYPLTKNCFGDYIHGDDAGKPIRHHRMPNLSTEPHFLSFQTGVVSHLDPGNDDEAKHLC
jgi:hypothetical protein